MRSGFRIKSGMTKAEFYKDHQNCIIQVSFSIKLASYPTSGGADPEP
jgi:hypothetical protein